MIVKTIIQGLAAAAAIAVAGLAWAEVAAPPAPPAKVATGTGYLTAPDRPDDRPTNRVAGGGDTGYLPTVLGRRDRDDDDDRDQRHERGEDHDD
ncbi:hypothetical protein [Caenispirillum salinarum]|uniref:hypothetical protein n=1 Tax=Caenispirillum salinarum TaxID=859058 RepID=UPI00384DE03C